MKRIITLLLTLVLTCCLFACDSCGNSALNRKNPTLTDTSSVFASIKETVNGTEYTYSVTKGQLYLGLKKEFGSSALINLVDEYLLKSLNNANNVSYYESVEEAAIKEQIKLDVYGKDNIDENGNVTLSDDKKAEAIEKFLETMCVSYGCNESDIFGASIMKKYQLTLAKKAYANDKLIAEIKETNEKYQEYLGMTDAEKAAAEEGTLVTAPYFADSKYASLYNADHVKEYTAIVVPFTTQKNAEDALKTIGVEVKDGKWAVNGTELTNDEVVAKYIALFELVYGYKYDSLTKDSDAFVLEAADINANVANRLKDMEANEYFATPYLTSAGSLYYYVLKLAENEVVEFEDLDDEAKEAAKAEYEADLREGVLTTTYISTKLAELRKEKNFAIYDDVLENTYVTSVATFKVEYKETTDEKANIVASVDGKEFTAEELFATMCELGETAVLIDLLVSQRLFVNPTLNVYYANGTWIDKEMEKEIENKLDEEKKNFNAGTYKEYGFDPELIGWGSFLEGSYGISSDDELKDMLLVQQISNDFADNVNIIEKHTVTKDENGKKVYNFAATEEEVKSSELWKDLEAAMQKTVDEYFNVKGVHILISAYESVEDYQSGANLLDPTADDTLWTEEQKSLAAQFAKEISVFLADAKGTYQEKLENIVKAYKAAPVGKDSTSPLAKITSDGANPVVINLSQYKAAGLYVKWESLGTFSNGSMVEQFNDAVKAIWDKDMADGKTNRATVSEPIETKFGYHVYVNLASNTLSYIEKSSVGEGDNKHDVYRYLPTIGEIRGNVQENKLSSSVTSAITKYYNNYANELKGTYFISVLQYNAINKLMDTYTTTGAASKENVENFLGLYVDYVFETNLKYVTKDFITVNAAE